MGASGISIWQLVIILGIVLLLFGSKRLRHLGSDLGNALRGFKQAMSDPDANAKTDAIESQHSTETTRTFSETTEKKAA
ncbi:MAG: twin-arginine translocase TatA/TatE family subunit [Pseudomonadota bacterium]